MSEPQQLGQTFEIDGVVVASNEECTSGRYAAWIDLQGLPNGQFSVGQCRKMEGMQIPPALMPFIEVGARLKIQVTIVA